MIKVLLYEDNRAFREALTEAFSDSETVCLYKSFEHAQDVLKQIEEHQPDVVLMDIEMPKLSGLDALVQINETFPDTKVMIQTQFEDNHSLFVALCLGAWGYVLKTDSFEKFEQAVVDVHQGGSYFSPMMASKVRSFFSNGQIKKEINHTPLSERELILLNYLAEGLKNREIGKKMFLSPETVKTHLSSIYKKLHVNSRMKAVAIAIERKLI